MVLARTAVGARSRRAARPPRCTPSLPNSTVDSGLIVAPFFGLTKNTRPPDRGRSGRRRRSDRIRPTASVSPATITAFTTRIPIATPLSDPSSRQAHRRQPCLERNRRELYSAWAAAVARAAFSRGSRRPRLADSATRGCGPLHHPHSREPRRVAGAADPCWPAPDAGQRRLCRGRLTIPIVVGRDVSPAAFLRRCGLEHDGQRRWGLAVHGHRLALGAQRLVPHLDGVGSGRQPLISNVPSPPVTAKNGCGTTLA